MAMINLEAHLLSLEAEAASLSESQGRDAARALFAARRIEIEFQAATAEKTYTRFRLAELERALDLGERAGTDEHTPPVRGKQARTPGDTD